MKRILLICIAAVIVLSSCSSTSTLTPEADMTLDLKSDAFVNGQSIPAKYSCIGKNISPALTWSDPPAGTQSFAFIMDDPDAPAGTWVHWVLYNIQADRRGLQEDLPVTGKNVDPNAIYFGKNSWGKISYGGPCPPSGTHRYYFKLYALDTLISLLPGATKEAASRDEGTHPCARRADGYVQQMTSASSLLQLARENGNPVIQGNRATFIWEGEEAQLPVSDATGWDDHPKPFKRLSPTPRPGSTQPVWSSSVTVTRDAYVEYAFLDPVSQEKFLDPLNQTPSIFSDKPR